MLTDATGAASWRAYPEAYGKAHIDSPAGVTFNVRFPGQYYDEESELWEPDGMGGGSFRAETGMHYNRWRYYSTELARYVSSDPIGQLGDTHLYRYVRNNPANSIDPTGLDEVQDFLDCFKADFDFAFGSTNDFFFGGWTRAARTGVGAITGGAVAKTTGGLTVVQAARAFARNGIGGLPALGTSGTLAATAIGTATNAALSTGALEAGIAVGSVADALGQTLAGNCTPPNPDGCGEEDGDGQR